MTTDKPIGYSLEDTHPSFIEVRVNEHLVKSTLILSMGALFNHPNYYEKHTLWNLSEAEMRLSFSDLNEIAGMLRLFKPEKQSFANKSAILVSGKMNVSLAKMFVGLTKLLPFEYRVFTNRSEAVSFLKA